MGYGVDELAQTHQLKSVSQCGGGLFVALAFGLRQHPAFESVGDTYRELYRVVCCERSPILGNVAFFLGRHLGTQCRHDTFVIEEDTADFVELMQAFASGEEPTSIMDRHAEGYTEEEMRALAEYFSER